MSRSISAIFVNYKTSGLLATAITSLRAASSRPLEIVVVDNSCDPEEARALASLQVDDLIVSPHNRGFAAGLNMGVERISGDLILSVNPDVEVEPEAIDLLVQAMEEGVGAVGPRFHWDAEGRWLLPPPESVSRLESFFRSVRIRGLGRGLDRLLTRRRLAYWLTERPINVPTLSGAVMMIERSVYDRLGGMDEGFHLYFEEVDFFRRMRKEGFVAIFEPRARCRHMFGRSAARNSNAREWYLESERRFHLKWHGESLFRLIKRLEGKGVEPMFRSLPAERAADDGSTFLELSADPFFLMPAGHLEQRGIDLPWDSIRQSHLELVYVREVERESGRVVWSSRLDPKELKH